MSNEVQDKPGEARRKEAMVYVAADPDQPGAAWAICVDMPEHKKDTAKSIAQWVKEGATVQYVPLEVGREMLMKWERPEKRKKASLDEQASLL